MQPGKLTAPHLRALLGRVPHLDPAVLISPAEGEDDAALLVDQRQRVVVATTDPITFAPQRPGWYAVHVNANDVATRGAHPRWFLATLLLPTESLSTLPTTIIDEIVAACTEVGASLVGGHTEVTPAVTQPLVVGTMLGTIDKSQLVRTSGAQPGDALLLTKGIAIEGTAILGAHTVSQNAVLPTNILERARAFLTEPGISVVKAALIAVQATAVHAMHDPTEGGLATAIHELCEAAHTGAIIDADAITIYPETAALCHALDLDPLGLLASGALLVSVAPDHA